MTRLRAAIAVFHALAQIGLGAPLVGQVPTGVIVNGIVRTRDGQPVPRARVRVLGREVEAFTDIRGDFRLALDVREYSSRPETLRVVRTGFASRNIAIQLRDSTLSVGVELTPVAISLDEVVVTATAGTQTRRAQPNVVTTLALAELDEVVPLATLPEALQGRVTSLDITPSSGSSGEAQRIWLRGGTSIALSNEPVFFIDGVRADARIQRLRPDVGGQASSRLFDLDPSEIDRVEIVKGPAASAMYGADASTGVIQIFTRRAALGHRQFSQSVDLSTGVIDPNYLPPSNFARCGAVDVQPDSPALPCHGLVSGAVVSDNPLRRAGLPTRGHTRELLWSADAGGSDFGIHAAVGASTEFGTLPQNGFDRRTLEFSSRWASGSGVLIDAGLGVMLTRTAHAQNGDNPTYGFLSNATQGSPLTVGQRTDGAFSTPIVALTTIDQLLHVVRATPRLQISRDPGGRLFQRVILGMDASNSLGRFFVPLRDDNAFGTNFSGAVREDHESYQLYTADYLGTLGLFNSPRGLSGKASLGIQYVQTFDETLIISGSGLVSNYANRVSDAAVRSANQIGPTQTRSLGTFGLLELAFRDRLFFQTALRGDQHSAFGPRAGPQIFPKAGLSLVVADRDRYASRLPLVQTLRFRAAYGASGRAVPQGAAGATYYPAAVMLDSTRIVEGVTPGGSGNVTLRPERTTEIELGADAGMFDNTLALEVTIFDKHSKDLLATLPQTPSLGFPIDPLGNVAGIIKNKGIETTANWSSAIATRRVDTQLGWSIVTNVAPHQHAIPLGAMYDYRVLRTDLAAGRAIVTDTPVFIGPSMAPRSAFAGLTVAIATGMRLHVDVDGKWRYLQHNMDSDVRDRYVGNSERAVESEGLSRDERLQRFGPFVTQAGQPVSTLAVLGPYLQDASFLRLRDVSLRWDLPRQWSAHLGGTDASITVAGRNLALWTRYEGDPEEVFLISENANGGAIQYGQPTLFTMPQARRWVARLSLLF